MRWQLEKLWMIFRLGKDVAKQIKAVLAWINTVAREDDGILAEFFGYRRFFYFEFPLRYGDPPKTLRQLPHGRSPTFIIRQSRSSDDTDEAWLKIFVSPEIEILENGKRVSSIIPLRWGLNHEEKIIALELARSALERFLETGERPNRNEFQNLPPRFYLKTNLDVALWTNGRLRGSHVIENRPLGGGIIEAAIGASRDARFKPLFLEELGQTRIEITVMSDLKMPLSESARKSSRILAEKGYLLQRGEAKGWYLPEVFNVRRFRNLEEFLGDLGREKAGLPPAAWKDADIFIFEAGDFMESEDRQRALTLRGPTVKGNSEFSVQQLELRLRMAADWLCRIQEPDGNIPLVTDPLTGRQTQIDWPRLAFTAWTLAEFGKSVKEEKYVRAAEKSFEYLKQYLISNSHFLIPQYELTLAYSGQLALALGKFRDAYLAADRILSRLGAISFEPIVFAQIASFFKVLTKSNKRFLEPFEKLCKILKENFEKSPKSGQAMNLAVWAELANTFRGVDDHFSSKVAEWLNNQQLPNGAFPESTAGGVPYSRGSGKIFEVLALDPQKNKEALERVLTWLIGMQYDEENTFFIPEEIRPKILGGFRHDYFNQEAWIDAAGHIFLGGARLTLFLKENTMDS